MEVRKESPKKVAKKMTGFNLFDAEITDTAAVVIDGKKVVAFVQFDQTTINRIANGAVVYEIESQIKGGGSALIEWMKENYDIIRVKNSGKDSWGFWKKMGFSQTAENGYYSEFEWEYQG